MFKRTYDEQGNRQYKSEAQRVAEEKLQKRIENLKPILEAAVEACRRLGGFASLDERYIVVDTKYFDVKQKEGVKYNEPDKPNFKKVA